MPAFSGLPAGTAALWFAIHQGQSDPYFLKGYQPWVFAGTAAWAGGLSMLKSYFDEIAKDAIKTLETAQQDLAHLLQSVRLVVGAKSKRFFDALKGLAQTADPGKTFLEITRPDLQIKQLISAVRDYFQIKVDPNSGERVRLSLMKPDGLDLVITDWATDADVPTSRHRRFDGNTLAGKAFHTKQLLIDIFRYIVESRPDFLSQITGLLEQTTCGSNALRRLLAQHDLKVRAVDINNAFLKRFDNRFETQESLLCSLTNTGITIGGKRVAVVGYGVVGEGAAKALRSLGASVAVVEADILKLAQARWEGFIPLTLEEALATSDLVLTATGCAPTITGEMIDANAHSGLILANVGHGREEYDVGWLERHPAELFNCYRRAYRLQDGRRIHSLCEGALVNFIAGPANPSGVMSLTFTLCSLVHIEMAASEPHKVTGLMAVDESLERLCAELNFPELQAKVYKLSRQQRQYLALE
jgi:adenosylhomocysteinase